MKTLTLAATACLAVLITASLSGCRTEYHGYDSGIDDRQWRQIAAFEDPLSAQLFEPTVNEPDQYLAALNGARWDRLTATPGELRIEEGGVVLYDISSTTSAAALSVFITSASEHEDGAERDARFNPSAVYTCYGIEATFGQSTRPLAERIIYSECPSALLELVPRDAAFASAEVFDG